MRTARTEYGKRLDQIQNRISVRLEEQPTVSYSAYESAARELPIDNLDDIAVHGSVQFHAEHDPFWGDGKAYVSAIVDSPSWLDVSVLANETSSRREIQMTQEEAWLNRGEARKVLRVSTCELAHLREVGALRFIKKGNAFLYAAADCKKLTRPRP